MRLIVIDFKKGPSGAERETLLSRLVCLSVWIQYSTLLNYQSYFKLICRWCRTWTPCHGPLLPRPRFLLRHY